MIRIVVNVSEGNPELYRDLLTIPIRQRAERMRTLASIGLCDMYSGQGISSGDKGGDTESSQDPIKRSTVKLIVHQLKGSLT